MERKIRSTITGQMRHMGTSPDWEREYFTMDETRSKVVADVFVRLYEEGLIYRGKRLSQSGTRFWEQPFPIWKSYRKKKTGRCGISVIPMLTVRVT